MKYHALIFFKKLGKMSQNLSSAAVVIGTLRVNTVYMIKDGFSYINTSAPGGCKELRVKPGICNIFQGT